MPGLTNHFKRFFDWVCLTIDQNSRPNPKYTQDPSKFEVAHMRNKAIISIFLVIIMQFIIASCLDRAVFQVNTMRSMCCIIIILVQLISCKYHPQVFEVFISLVLIAYGPIMMFATEQGIQKAWFSAIIIPILCYLFTGSLTHFLFQGVIQSLYINTFYFNILERRVTFMTPKDFSEDLTNAMNQALFYSSIVMTLTYCLMQRVQKRIAIAEKKKEEFENQKTFLLGFSHELRNHINSLTGNVKLASLEVLSERARELLLNAEVCGELMLHLINNILDTGKAEIGELEINAGPTKIYETLEKVWGVCAELIRMKNLRGRISIQKNLPATLRIDHYRLTQIILNLVGNAVKFTEKGSIDVKVNWLPSHSEGVDEKYFQPYPFNYFAGDDEGLFEKDQTFSNLDQSLLTLDVQSRRINRGLLSSSAITQRGILKVSISDTGSGMSEEELGKLFQKFHSIAADPSKRKLGTGLGLFITKQLCQRMQGDVRAFSQKGLGSSFIFCIPAEALENESQHLQNTDSTQGFIRTRKLRALIVDDAPFNNIVLKSFFDKLGVEVIDCAVNGLEAYQKYQELARNGDGPDIVTMDVEMPIMTGKEAAQKIREFEKLKALKPCLMTIVSGNCSESEIFECINREGNVKADAFLKKPASIEDLAQVLGRHFI